MGVGRILSSCAAAAAVGGCVVVAVGMSRAASAPDGAASSPFSMPALPSSTPAESAVAPWTPYRTPATRSASTTPSTHPATHRRVTPKPTRAAPPPAATSTHSRTPKPAPKPPAKPTPRRGQSLPVSGGTNGATRVITVVAPSHSSTTATLQAWVAAPGGGWLKHGSPVPAHVGADGLSTAASESRSATPIGSFSLTQAFGAYSDPGTALPYFRTTASDWWISQSGPLYNTHQHCASGCGFSQGAPNEHLANELPYYRYAVVIDYNTRNAPGGVRQGRGSAFFLHVTDGRATAGCVAIDQSRLVSIMQWLAPSAHPRILIGVA